MKIEQALTDIHRLHIETAPLIYFVERNPTYVDRVRDIIRRVEAGQIRAVSSVITLTEVLGHPIRQQRQDLEDRYRAVLTGSRHFMLLPVSQAVAERAARLRATYNLKTPDALQMATALEAACDAFLTNDRGLLRVTDLKVLLVDDLEL